MRSERQMDPTPDELFPPLEIKTVAYYRIVLYLVRVKRGASLTEIKKGPSCRKPDNHHRRYTEALESLIKQKIVVRQMDERGRSTIVLKNQYQHQLAVYLFPELLDMLEEKITAWARLPYRQETTMAQLLRELEAEPGLSEAAGANITYATFEQQLRDTSATLEEFNRSWNFVKTVEIPSPAGYLRKYSLQKRAEWLFQFFKPGRDEEERLHIRAEIILHHLQKTTDQEELRTKCMEFFKNNPALKKKGILPPFESHSLFEDMTNKEIKEFQKVMRDIKRIMMDNNLPALTKTVFKGGSGK